MPLIQQLITDNQSPITNHMLIKASRITNLTDARYFAAKEVDFLGFNLEEGTEGAAFLAMKSGAPIVPVAMTGTENDNIYNGKFWKRAKVTLAVGKPFHLKEYDDRQIMLREGTKQIMQSLAELLPKKYRGKYADSTILP